MRKKSIIFILPILIFGVLIFFGNKNSTKKEKQSSTDLTTSNNNIIWLINTQYIEFQYKKIPPDLNSNEVFISAIDKNKYPRLFENLDENMIKIVPFNVKDKTFYLLANVYHEAGGFSLHYALVIDIFNENNPLFETKENYIKGVFPTIEILDNGDIRVSRIGYHFDFCRSCGYEIFDYFGYIEGQGFQIKNTFYKDKFKELFEKLESQNKCFVKKVNKELTFEEIKNKFGESYQCDSSHKMIEFKGISPKDYFNLKEKVQKIIENQQISIFD